MNLFGQKSYALTSFIAAALLGFGSAQAQPRHEPTEKVRFVGEIDGCLTFSGVRSSIADGSYAVRVYTTCDFQQPLLSWPLQQDGPPFQSTASDWTVNCSSKTVAHLRTQYYSNQFWRYPMDLIESKNPVSSPALAKQQPIVDLACRS